MSVTFVPHARRTSRVALSCEKRPTKETYKWVPYKRPSYVYDLCDIRLVLYHTRHTKRIALSCGKRPTKEAYKRVLHKRPSCVCDLCDTRLELYHTRHTKRVALSREKRPTKEAYKRVLHKRPSCVCFCVLQDSSCTTQDTRDMHVFFPCEKRPTNKGLKMSP